MYQWFNEEQLVRVRGEEKNSQPTLLTDSRNQSNNVKFTIDFNSRKNSQNSFCVGKIKTTNPNNSILMKTNLNRIDHEAIHMFSNLGTHLNTSDICRNKFP